MLSMTKKWSSALLSIALVSSFLAACSSNNNNSNTSNTTSNTSTNTNTSTNESTSNTPAEAKPNGLDISKQVDLQFYMLGDAPKDLAKIQAEINKMAEKDLNVDVTFNYTTWTDWDQKYKLLLSTGQPVDLIFTADWTQYQSYAKGGAFLPLDDLLPKAAPTLQQFVPQEMWDAVKIDQKIYTVPATYKEYVTNGFVWREDLREKYNLPKPVDLTTFEAYLDGIKKNEPTMQPLAVGADVRGALSDTYREIAHNPVGGPLPYGIGITYDKPGDVYSYWGSDEQLADLKTYKRWADNGYISKNELNEKTTDQEKLTTGKAAAMLGDNPTRYNATNQNMQSTHPDWSLGYYPFPLARGLAIPNHPIHNGFAIPKSSKNPERALAFYEKMVLDKRYNQLTEYGIEGTNYSVDNGYYQMVGDVNSNGFPREAMNGWAWRNPEFMLFDHSYDGVKAIFEQLDKVQKPDIFTGFAEDYSTYQAERAALDQVEKQYLYPLIAGQVSDIEGGLKTFMEKAKQAGLEKVQTEYTKQWKQYLTDKGIQ
ncbi:extracellular solute-binding protein [Paenibacillus sp. OV219]|uniref:extracellular solute-binding protein n=1 Tax=Paenibacillus sp. OV219 TaxID=1884377 RepID=UPI0008CEFEF1|nr:extracellular solute-binding protein [Paenibacillus sp. OV219]SEN96836.1 putative aldouronate transport system substrate-binding protein [Paenibacillus sp. OV219]